MHSLNSKPEHFDRKPVRTERQILMMSRCRLCGEIVVSNGSRRADETEAEHETRCRGRSEERKRA